METIPPNRAELHQDGGRGGKREEMPDSQPPSSWREAFCWVENKTSVEMNAY